MKQIVNAIACTIELWVHLGGLLSTQEARVALGYRLVRLLRVATNCDWSMKITPLSNVALAARASLLVERKLTAKAELSCEIYKF